MPRITMIYGALLVLLGIGGYLASHRASPTALIPAAFGLPVLLLGVLALREGMRRHAMHAASALALIGFVATAGGLLSAGAALAGAEVARPGAVAAKAIMALLSAAFVALAVRSFVAARRARQTPGPSGPR